ncbi:MAG TPA: ATP-binding protein [Polyangiaceae bacterium]|nr:ATP-binding protein [Polyangiaceae bacterium]
MPRGPERDERVALFAPFGRDAALAARVFETAGVATAVCDSAQGLCDALERGIGALFVTEEALTPAALECLGPALRRQPPWSDVPLLIATSAGEMTRLSLGRVRELEGCGNVVLLERPLRGRTLANAAQAALRARRRQYDMRDLLDEREQWLARERAARAAAEEANRLKDEFLATLSHELRTPLNSILGWADMLLEGGLGEASERRGLETIHRNARAQAKLIEDVLDVSRIIAGKLRLQARPCDLVEVVRAAVDALQPAADAKGVAVDVRLAPSAPGLTGDPDRLQQIVWNLLSNAIKFTPPGGRVEVRGASDGAWASLAVRDTGRGIAPDFLPHVFDRFRQQDGTATRAEGGLGLGLAIVRHLAEAHGGSVRAESEGEGRGATFTLRLPLGAPAPPPRPSSPRRADGDGAAPLAGLRVLLVEDEPDSRLLLATVLERAGAVVRAEGSAREGLGALDAERFDVIVSDIGMPGEDGFAFLRTVRARAPERGGATPAAALTAYTRKEDRYHAAEAGFQAYLPKPFDSGALCETLRALALGAPPPRLDDGA